MPLAILIVDINLPVEYSVHQKRFGNRSNVYDVKREP